MPQIVQDHGTVHKAAGFVGRSMTLISWHFLVLSEVATNGTWRNLLPSWSISAAEPSLCGGPHVDFI